MFAVAFAAIVLALPAAASAADPGIDEYTLKRPKADGDGHVGPKEPVSRPQDLPAGIREQLAEAPDGETLTKIATSRELGAPEPAGQGANDSGDSGAGESSALAATGNALDDSSSLLVVALIVAVALAAVAIARRRGTT